MNLEQTERGDLTILLINFCEINDIDPNSEYIQGIVQFLQREKGRVYLDTFKKQLDNWSSGRMEEVRKPRKLTVHFLGTIIEKSFGTMQKNGVVTHSGDTEYKPSQRVVNKTHIFALADANGVPRKAAYGILVDNEAADNMNRNQIEREFNRVFI